ncbi:GNAT family N-acetyltransferase [Psychrobacillus sp. NPDC058041]|uniref:GNAT family N-acetyltransferase n=1 Tax=Psychrobacillus sp. NPDC058041 TaxID=3346310 RepID=UPI0036D95EC0
MIIKLAGVSDLVQILEVLNKVTIALQNKNINQWSYPWDSEYISNEISEEKSYKLMHNESVIGTFFIETIDKIGEYIIEPESLYLSKIAILPEYQGSNIGSKITDFACTNAQKLNKVLYIDCWAGNIKLKEFYSKNGFQYIGDFSEEDYLISIFRSSKK